MLYFYYGSDREKAGAKARELLAALRKERPEAEVFRMNAEDFSEARLEELAGGQGLFHKTHLVFLNRICESAEAAESFLAHIAEVADSPNVFIALEGAVGAETLKRVKRHAAEIAECGGKAGKEKKDFSLSDAFARRDKKAAWVLLVKALMRGEEPEKLHGGLFWQVKAMILASAAESAADAGLHPFVFQKSRRFAAHWTPEELRALSARLVALYHDAHRGRSELPIALERLVLSL